jgi:hypothetical protein
MQKWLWGYAGAVFLVGTITVAQNVWNLGKSDWADWATAFGTISAVAVALKLASNDSRRRASESNDIARLIAAAVTTPLGEVCKNAELVANDLDRKLEGKPDLDTIQNVFGTLIETLIRVELPTDDQRLALVPLPNGCAFNLAKAGGLLRVAIVEMQRLPPNNIDVPKGTRKEVAEKVRPWVKEASLLLRAATAECERASRELIRPIA